MQIDCISLSLPHSLALSLSLVLAHLDAIPCVSRLKMRTNFFLPLFSSFFIVENCCLFTFYSSRFDIHIATAAVTVVFVFILILPFHLLLLILSFRLRLTIAKQICTLIYEWKFRAWIFYYYICQSFRHKGTHTHKSCRHCESMKNNEWKKTQHIVIKKSSLASWIESINGTTVWTNERNEQNEEEEEDEKITLYM